MIKWAPLINTLIFKIHMFLQSLIHCKRSIPLAVWCVSDSVCQCIQLLYLYLGGESPLIHTGGIHAEALLSDLRVQILNSLVRGAKPMKTAAR